MKSMLERYGLGAILRNAEGGGSGGEGGDGGAGGGTPETVLFPNEGKGEGNGDEKKPADGVAENAADDDKGATEWKEYVPDPNKTDEENAAAKAEHDKGKPEDKSDDPADKVPEDGKYDLKMPDGIELDQELADALGPEFADLKLTNAQAQKLVDKYTEIQKGRAEKQGQTWAETISGWADTAKKDPEIGGAKWDGTVSDATRAINKLGTPALKEYLNASGGGNHPEVIRIMAKVGAMIKEDNPASGGAEGAGKPAEAAHVLFPNDAPKGN